MQRSHNIGSIGKKVKKTFDCRQRWKKDQLENKAELKKKDKSSKDALVKEDSKSTSANATTLLNKLNKVDMKLLSDNKAHNHWMSLEGEIKSSATSISETSDIKSQRDHFKHLSSHLINAVQLFGVDEKVYVEFCPMADNNNGAYWLSKEEKVINPYFGSAMLTCGEVKQVIE